MVYITVYPGSQGESFDSTWIAFLLSVCRGIPSERPRRAGRVALTGGARIFICVKEGTRHSQPLPNGTGSKLTRELLTYITGQVQA